VPKRKRDGRSPHTRIRKRGRQTPPSGKDTKKERGNRMVMVVMRRGGKTGKGTCPVKLRRVYKRFIKRGEI